MNRKPTNQRAERRADALAKRRDERKALPAQRAAARAEEERLREQPVEPAQESEVEARRTSMLPLYLLAVTRPLALSGALPPSGGRGRHS